MTVSLLLGTGVEPAPLKAVTVGAAAPLTVGAPSARRGRSGTLLSSCDVMAPSRSSLDNTVIPPGLFKVLVLLLPADTGSAMPCMDDDPVSAERCVGDGAVALVSLSVVSLDPLFLLKKLNEEKKPPFSFLVGEGGDAGVAADDEADDAPIS